MGSSLDTAPIRSDTAITTSIIITFEKDVRAGGRDAGSVAGTGELSIEAEIKTKDIDQLFMGLEQAKLSKIKRRA